MKKQYVGISCDHSGSIQSYGLVGAATKDYNDGIAAIKKAAADTSLDTIVSVVSFHSTVKREVVNSSVDRLKPITSYPIGGSTALFDSVGELIEIFKKVPDYNDPEVTFLIMAITDGEENASHFWKSALAGEIRKLQATDRWTFVFRVPKGFKNQLVSLGIYEGNIQEWETTERGLREASVQTVSAVVTIFLVSPVAFVRRRASMRTWTRSARMKSQR